MRVGGKRGVSVGAWLRYMWCATRDRVYNRALDVVAILAGYCNHKPYSPIPGEGGMWSHWRCALRRGHYCRGITRPDWDLHRMGNYVWDDSGDTTYYPHGKSVQQPWDRRMQHTMRERRALNRWQRARDCERATRFGA